MYGTLQEPLQVVLVVRRVAVGSPERSGARLELHELVGLPRRHEPRREAVVVEAVVVMHEEDGASMREAQRANQAEDAEAAVGEDDVKRRSRGCGQGQARGHRDG